MMVCCFCGKNILSVDFPVRMAISSADPKLDFGVVQELYAHGKCLEELVSDNIPFSAEAFFE